MEIPTLLTPTELVSSFKDTFGGDCASIARTLGLRERDVGTDYIKLLDALSLCRTSEDISRFATAYPCHPRTKMFRQLFLPGTDERKLLNCVYSVCETDLGRGYLRHEIVADPSGSGKGQYMVITSYDPGCYATLNQEELFNLRTVQLRAMAPTPGTTSDVSGRTHVGLGLTTEPPPNLLD